MIKGLIPLADLTGKEDESLDSGSVRPTKEVFGRVYQISSLLVAAASHSLTLSCPRGSPLTSKIVWCSTE